MELLMDGSYLSQDGDVKWGAFLRSLNTCFNRYGRISPEELHTLILPLNSLAIFVLKRVSE